MPAQISEKDLNTWADYLLNHSLGGIDENDVVMIKGEHITWPLMSVLQDKIFAAGGIADINITAPDNDRGKVWGASIARHGSKEQIEKVPDWQTQRYKNMNKFIEVLGAEDPGQFTGVNEELAQAVMRADKPIKDIRLSKQWVITLYPTEGFAEVEGMTLDEYTDVIVSASTIDPKYLEEVEEDIYQLMDNGKEIKIISEHPDSGKELTLTMDIDKRNAVKCTGHRNFPDGEVFTSPNFSTVNGEIFVDLPVYQGSDTIEGIYLRFENGVIKEYNAKKGDASLRKIIETDEGSHRLGEVALGMNNGISKVLKHPLFVEKIGATLHIAIGQSYPECYESEAPTEEEKNKLMEQGKLNKSSQHVDIVTDFRPGGSGRAVYIDGTKLEIKDNIWVVPGK